MGGVRRRLGLPPYCRWCLDFAHAGLERVFTEAYSAQQAELDPARLRVAAGAVSAAAAAPLASSALGAFKACTNRTSALSDRPCADAGRSALLLLAWLVAVAGMGWPLLAAARRWPRQRYAARREGLVASLRLALGGAAAALCVAARLPSSYPSATALVLAAPALALRLRFVTHLPVQLSAAALALAAEPLAQLHRAAAGGSRAPATDAWRARPGGGDWLSMALVVLLGAVLPTIVVWVQERQARIQFLLAGPRPLPESQAQGVQL